MTEVEARDRFESARRMLLLEKQRLEKAGCYAWLSWAPHDELVRMYPLPERASVSVILRDEAPARELAAHWLAQVFEYSAVGEANMDFAHSHDSETGPRWHLSLQVRHPMFVVQQSNPVVGAVESSPAAA